MTELDPRLSLYPPWPADRALCQEWLVTNGLGGYASGTVVGASTRRYHGLLTSALPSPRGRTVMLDRVLAQVRLPDQRQWSLEWSESMADGLQRDDELELAEFSLEMGLPVWRYRVAGVELERRVLMPAKQNTVHVQFSLTPGSVPAELSLRPAMNFRPHDALVPVIESGAYRTAYDGDRYEIYGPIEGMPLRLAVLEKPYEFEQDPRAWGHLKLRTEELRGYQAQAHAWSPGSFTVGLEPGHSVTVVASTESWSTALALDPQQASKAERERRQRLLFVADKRTDNDPARQLVLAADQFLIEPAERVGDFARVHAGGDDPRTVIAGYHWFTDWGRDTMISLEGLVLVTGRYLDAGYVLRTFRNYVRDGLVPNFFPEGDSVGVYHTADATLWYFHALQRYLKYTDDRLTLNILLPVLIDIVEHHIEGTRFGIGVDPSDGLLRQGAPGYALTWMDAKVDDWVVTPRRGKAVEINALWYNALRLLARWVHESGDGGKGARYDALAERVQTSFNERMWNEELCHLNDLVDGEDGDDPACRPNQIFALSLCHPVLDRSRWKRVVTTVRDRLLTPVGLRTLSADHPDYQQEYTGDVYRRDAAYHQGTVWPWLIGHFIDAWLRVFPNDTASARQMLLPLVEQHLRNAGVGSVSEIFDAEAPFRARGCIAQAWSVAELLRAWVETSE